MIVPSRSWGSTRAAICAAVSPAQSLLSMMFVPVSGAQAALPSRLANSPGFASTTLVRARQLSSSVFPGDARCA
jgi:hypothetical protein